MRISDWSSDVCSSDLPTPKRSSAAPVPGCHPDDARPQPLSGIAHAGPERWQARYAHRGVCRPPVPPRKHPRLKEGTCLTARLPCRAHPLCFRFQFVPAPAIDRRMADGFASPGNGITDDGYYTVADCVDPSVDREVAALLPCVDPDGLLCEAGYLIDGVQLAKPVVSSEERRVGKEWVRTWICW